MATGIDVRVGGKRVKGVSAYTVEEEATPVDASDSTGATGRFGFTFFSAKMADAKRMRGKVVDLEDRGQGTTQGIARMPNYSGGNLTLSVDSRATLLVVERTAQPYAGTLGGYFIYLLGLVDITTGYYVEPSIADIPVTFPGWQGDVWFQMKNMLAAKGVEVSLVSDLIVMRPLRGRVTVDKRDLEYSWSSDDSNLALSIEGYYYQNHQETGYLAYPSGGWNEDVQVYQVDAAETIEFNIPITASLSSVVQPVVQDNVERDYKASSVYSVMASDGLPLPAAQWIAEGGSISVKVGEDTRSLIVTITGAADPTGEYAPYRIAATAGPSDNYSSLRIVGTGVFYDKTLVTMNTAVSTDRASQEVGAKIDNEFISTIEELYDAMIWTLARFAGPRQTLTIRTVGVNRSGQTGVYSYPTIADFNAYATSQGWTSIADFNAAYSGDLIADFNEWWFAQVADTFENQAFGNIAGARTKRDSMWWRIRKATISPDSITYTAEADTVISDFNEEWTGKTIADFNAEWAGRTISDFNVAPLERAP